MTREVSEKYSISKPATAHLLLKTAMLVPTTQVRVSALLTSLVLH